MTVLKYFCNPLLYYVSITFYVLYYLMLRFMSLLLKEFIT